MNIRQAILDGLKTYGLSPYDLVRECKKEGISAASIYSFLRPVKPSKLNSSALGVVFDVLHIELKQRSSEEQQLAADNIDRENRLAADKRLAEEQQQQQEKRNRLGLIGGVPKNELLKDRRLEPLSNHEEGVKQSVADFEKTNRKVRR